MRRYAQVFVGFFVCVISIFGEGFGAACHKSLQLPCCKVRSKALKTGQRKAERAKFDSAQLAIVESQVPLRSCREKSFQELAVEYPAALEIRESIHQMRALVKKELSDGVAIEEITDYATRSIIGVLSKSIELAKKDLFVQGKTCSTAYAIAVLGSLASGDGSPYSDLDFCILVKEDTQAVRAYFEDLITLFNKIIVSFGETHSGIRGIQICDGDQSPPYKDARGIHGLSFLLNTPQGLAQTTMQVSKNGKSRGVIYRSLEVLAFADGDPQLVDQYFQAKAVASSLPVSKSSNRKLYQEKGLELMREIVRIKEELYFQEALNPQTGLRMFNPKFFFLSPIKMGVLGLARYYGIPEVRVLRCLELLSQRGLLNHRFAERLAEAYRFGLKIRLQAHLAQGSRYDWVFIGAPVQNCYRLTPKEEEAYPNHRCTVQTLRESLKEFLGNPGCPSFVNVAIPSCLS
jgi:predicted nucleotidyltransferase